MVAKKKTSIFDFSETVRATGWMNGASVPKKTVFSSEVKFFAIDDVI